MKGSKIRELFYGYKVSVIQGEYDLNVLMICCITKFQRVNLMLSVLPQ